MGTGASKKLWDNLLVIVAFGVILLVSGRSYPQVAGARTRTVTRRDLFPRNHAIIACASPQFHPHQKSCHSLAPGAKEKEGGTGAVG